MPLRFPDEVVAADAETKERCLQMYGYVVVNQEELRGRELKEYRRYYCGLCHALREQYRLAGQCTVNYDSAFLALLLSSLYDLDTESREACCMVHPLKAQPYERNAAISYVADMNVLLSYLKCMDDWKDERKVLRYFYGRVLGARGKRLRQRYGTKVRRIFREMRTLLRLEHAEEGDFDLLAACFGRMMGEVFAWRQDEWENDLREVGFHLGKFIYLTDAYDDYEEDLKKARFNPLQSVAERIGRERMREWVRQVLELMAADCARAFERLPIVEHVEILRNILYSGIWTAFRKKKNLSGEWRKD